MLLSDIKPDPAPARLLCGTPSAPHCALRTMSIRYEANFDNDVLFGRGVKVKENREENSLCHKFTLRDNAGAKVSSIKILAGETVETEWLFGPATLLKTRTIIYPCSRNKCSIPCACKKCRKPALSLKCQVLASQPCSCWECLDEFEDHKNFHGCFHVKCKYCIQLIQILPNLNFWFLKLGNRPRKVLYEMAAREHFRVKDLVKNSDPPAKIHPYRTSGNTYYPTYEMFYEEEKQHMISGGLITCDECNFSVTKIEQFKEHIELNHLVSKRFFHCYVNLIKEVDHSFACSQCEANFNSITELKQHAQKEHLKTKYSCDICDKDFTRKDLLKRHKVSHFGDNEPYFCPNCDEKFTRKDARNRHIVLVHRQAFRHEDLADFVCDECDAVFTAKANLDRHKRASCNKDGSCKHVCNQCDSTFCTGKDLRHHKNKVHVVFSCDRCDELFTRQSHLQVHRENQKLLQCNECGKHFCNGKSLTNHRSSVHKHPVIDCDICGERFFVSNIHWHKLMAHKHTSE